MATRRTGGRSDLDVASPRTPNPMRVEKKTQLIVVILQDQTRIKGLVHLPSSGRLSDLMNYQAGERPFLAVTQAEIRLPDKTAHRAPFLAVNRNAVTTCFPTSKEEDAKWTGSELPPRLRPRG